MDVLKRAGVMTLAAAFGLSPLVVGQAASAAAGDGDRLYANREDSVTEVVAIDNDDDLDDDTSRSRTGGDGTGATANSNDGTNSRMTGVTRGDRDVSRGDLTKDVTRDGKGDLTRDNSRHATNDSSRDDTR